MDKRRDNRGRPLHTGEVQCEDGRYRYKYTDLTGKRKSIYSWRLHPSDKTPPGKRDSPSLREQEQLIQAELSKGVAPPGRLLTVVELCEQYLSVNNNFRENTKVSHQSTLALLKKLPFGQRPIGEVKILEAKLFLVSLQQEHGKSYSTIHSIRGVLRPAFRLALESEYITRNPFDFPLKDVLVNDSVTRNAITREQERKFLNFIRNDPSYKEYYDAIYILFQTGMRISEFCGLTLKDIDMKQRMIDINHQLQRKRDGTLYILENSMVTPKTKTDSGKRRIPMLTEEVYQAFRRLIRDRQKPDIEPTVDGFGGFLILNHRARKGIRPMVGMDWEHIFARILEKYNSIYREQLPKITPHVCRHTCCNNLANSGMSPSHLQYFMGHADISVTMGHYVHTKCDDTSREIDRMREEGRLEEPV